MKSKRSPATDSSMASMADCGYEGVDSDEKYTHGPNWQLESNRPQVSQDAAAKNVDAAFGLGLVARQKL